MAIYIFIIASKHDITEGSITYSFNSQYGFIIYTMVVQILLCILARKFQKIRGTFPYSCECLKKYNSPEDDPPKAEKTQMNPANDPQFIAIEAAAQNPQSKLSNLNKPQRQQIYDANNLEDNAGLQEEKNRPNSQI